MIWAQGAWFLLIFVKDCPGGGPRKGRYSTRIFCVHPLTSVIQGVTIVMVYSSVVLILPNTVLILPNTVLILPRLILILLTVLVLTAVIEH